MNVNEIYNSARLTVGRKVQVIETALITHIVSSNLMQVDILACNFYIDNCTVF